MDKKNKKIDEMFGLKSVKKEGKNTTGKRKADIISDEEVSKNKKNDDKINTEVNTQVTGEEESKKKSKKTKKDTTDTKNTAEEAEDTSNNISSSPKKSQKIHISNPKNAVTSLNSMEDFANGLGTWREPLKKFAESEKMENIYKFLVSEYQSKTIYPPEPLIFNSFNHTTWDNVKIVIIGQDPYPGAGQAMGLSFSVNRGIPVPKSLINIYKCLEKDKNANFKAPKHGDLTQWADEGVFLLNAVLTVVAGKANSHQKTSGWSAFTDYVIQTISEKKSGVVFLLWGNFAIKKKSLIDTSKHHVIENIHPSPLAATKGDFTKSDQFSKANEYLTKEGRTPVNWALPI